MDYSYFCKKADAKQCNKRECHDKDCVNGVRSEEHTSELQSH